MTESFSIEVTQKLAEEIDLAIGLFSLSKAGARFEPARECVRAL